MMRTLAICALVLAACAAPAALDETTGTTQQRIEGGDVEPGLPNIGMLEFSTGNFGTGTLITPRVVLTAGHVVAGDIQGFYIGQGRPILRGPDFSVSADMKKYGLSQKIIDADLDVGLVLLDAPASEYVPLTLGGGSLSTGMGCSTTGYGDHVVDWDAADASPFVKEKRTASVKLISMSSAELGVDWVTGISDHGDSGGPLFCNSALVGTTAYHLDGDDSAHETEFYVRVDAALPWVHEQLTAWGDTTLDLPAADAAPADVPDASPTPIADAPPSSATSGGCSSTGAPDVAMWPLALLAILALRFAPTAARRRVPPSAE